MLCVVAWPGLTRHFSFRYDTSGILLCDPPSLLSSSSQPERSIRCPSFFILARILSHSTALPPFLPPTHASFHACVQAYRVYVGNVSWSTTAEELKNSFAGKGFNTLNSNIPLDSRGRSRGFGALKEHTCCCS